MTVPQAIPEPQEQELYDLVPSADDDPVRLAFAAARRDAAAAAEVANLAPPPETTRRGPASPFLAYQRAPSQREQERAPGGSAVVDIARDVYAPVALLLIGLASYVAYYAIRGQLSGKGIALLTIGLCVLTAFKALLLIGFALLIAGPLGVSFGGVWTAMLKLAAIAVFADGTATWVDAGVAKISGAGGAFTGMLSFPVVLGIYWLLLIYLFSMDAGDSWFVVILLAVFDGIVRWVLLLLLMNSVLRWGGAPAASLPVRAFGGSGGAVSADPMTEHITELKEFNLLKEAREYIAGGRQGALLKPTEAWYAAGCKNVWFEVSRDINGRLTPVEVIAELPKDADATKQNEKRAKCYEILKAYYAENNMPEAAAGVRDAGDNYIVVGVR